MKVSDQDRARAGRWPAYYSFLKRALSSHLAYVPVLWVNLFALGSGFAFTLLIWKYARSGSGGNPEFFAYLNLAFALNFTFSMTIERYVAERIREGLIATDLLKPVDYTWLIFFQASSDVAFQTLFGLLIAGVATAFLGPLMAPASLGSLGLAAVSAILAFWIHFHLGFLILQLVFATHSNYGPGTLRILLHTAFSGIFCPLDRYPPAFQQVALQLPFRHVIYTPVAIYQGRLAGVAATDALLSQLLWGAILFGAARGSFRLIRRQLTIQGG